MRLYELFDKVADWKWTKQTHNYCTAVANKLDIDMTFEKTDSEKWSASFTRNGYASRTDAGNEFEVFATVLDIMSAFILLINPGILEFSASGVSSRKKII
jgi:hypothetical protein